MSDLRQTAQQALEALGKWSSGRDMDAVELNDLIATLETALEQPEQAPAAWIQPDHLQKAKQAPFLCRVEPTQRCADFVPFFTHPPRRDWRGLSKDESLKLWGMRSDGPSNTEITSFARAIEAALKERNL
jgi:hypothetical protein